jgi:hypothetical protein
MITVSGSVAQGVSDGFQVSLGGIAVTRFHAKAIFAGQQALVIVDTGNRAQLRSLFAGGFALGQADQPAVDIVAIAVVGNAIAIFTVVETPLDNASRIAKGVVT